MSTLQDDLDGLAWLDDGITAQVIPAHQVVNLDLVAFGNAPQRIAAPDCVLERAAFSSRCGRGGAVEQCKSLAYTQLVWV